MSRVRLHEQLHYRQTKIYIIYVRQLRRITTERYMSKQFMHQSAKYCVRCFYKCNRKEFYVNRACARFSATHKRFFIWLAQMTVCGMALHMFAFGRIICHLRWSDKRIDMAATLFYLTPKSPTAFDKFDLSHTLFALACKVCVGNTVTKIVISHYLMYFMYLNHRLISSDNIACVCSVMIIYARHVQMCSLGSTAPLHVEVLRCMATHLQYTLRIVFVSFTHSPLGIMLRPDLKYHYIIVPWTLQIKLYVLFVVLKIENPVCWITIPFSV